jgi:hypothetical protein
MQFQKWRVARDALTITSVVPFVTGDKTHLLWDFYLSQPNSGIIVLSNIQILKYNFPQFFETLYYKSSLRFAKYLCHER